MRVFIGNPAFRRSLDDGLERYMLGSGMRFPWSLLKHPEERPRYAIFPIFLAYTAAVLEADGVDVRVVDGLVVQLRFQVIAVAESLNPPVRRPTEPECRSVKKGQEYRIVFAVLGATTATHDAPGTLAVQRQCRSRS